MSVGLTKRAVLIGLIAVCTAIEIMLTMADRAVIGPPELRNISYALGAFRGGLLGDGRPLYAAQPWLMFLTYGFLHAGLAHMVFNMITLWSLGTAVLERTGVLGFLAIYAAATLGGATGFALSADASESMVGASGALFGLAGTLLAWRHAEPTIAAAGCRPVLWYVCALVALNLAMLWALDGKLAWEAHLGGFVAGWLLGLRIGFPAV